MTNDTAKLINELNHLAESCCEGSDFTLEHCIAGRAAIELELQAAHVTRLEKEVKALKEAYGIK